MLAGEVLSRFKIRHSYFKMMAGDSSCPSCGLRRSFTPSALYANDQNPECIVPICCRSKDDLDALINDRNANHTEYKTSISVAKVLPVQKQQTMPEQNDSADESEDSDDESYEPKFEKIAGICCQCLTRYNCKAHFGSRSRNFQFLKLACKPCQSRNEEWIWIACTEQGGSPIWMQADKDSGILMQNDRLTSTQKYIMDIPNLVQLEFPKHINRVPVWISKVTSLENLILDCCSELEVIPWQSLVAMPCLKSIECKDCLQLIYPPMEICKQGGEEVMNFLREVQRYGQYSKSMNLFLVGDGEAGKTSVIRALKSRDDRTSHIRADHRTVGIDICTWRPQAMDMCYRIYDLAGQEVYSRTHLFFLLRRAVYVYVWRSGSMKVSRPEDTVLHWLESLQSQVPGCYVLIVVTHIDVSQVSADELNAQCKKVKETATQYLKSLKSTLGGIQLPHIWANGESIRVDCLSGEGIVNLRDAIMKFTQQMPWYKEALPSSWIALHDGLQKRGNPTETPYLKWNQYEELIRIACVPESMISSVTKFMHDSGTIRYFGNFSTVRLKSSGLLLHDVVFISFNWMVNVMKGLIRYDHQALLEYFVKERNRQMLHSLNLLHVHGILQPEIISYLWPASQQHVQSFEYWKFIRSDSDREKELWPIDIISDQADLDCAIALLQGFGLVSKNLGASYIVPGVLRYTQFLSEVNCEIDICPYRLKFRASTIPQGAFDSLVVRASNIFRTVFDFSSIHASFGDEHGNLAQILLYSEELARNSERCLLLRSSSMQMINILVGQMEFLEQIYPVLSGSQKVQDQSSTKFWHPPNTWPGFIFSELCTANTDSADIIHTAVLPPVVEVPENRKCPCCMVEQEHFNAGKCRLLLKKATSPTKAVVTCHRCMANGRTGLVNILEVNPPEVLVCGVEALTAAAQDALADLIYHIEMESDVGCFIVEESKDAVWEEYVKKSVFVIVLATPVLLKSLSCEGLSSLRRLCHGKKIILIPDSTYSQTSWHKPETWDLISGQEKALLEEFQAFFEPAATLYPGLSLVSNEDLKQKIVANINLQLVRPGRLDVLSEFSTIGVRLSYLSVFVIEYGNKYGARDKRPQGREYFESMTTKDVVEKIIKPETINTKQSFCDLLLSESPRYVGKADWFYSHAWKYRFLDVIDAAKSFFQNEELDEQDPFLWFDIFTVSQHRAMERPLEWWNVTFLKSI